MHEEDADFYADEYDSGDSDDFYTTPPHHNDTPLELTPDYLRELTKLADAPPHIKRSVWGVFVRDVLLAHLAPEDRDRIRDYTSIIADIMFLMTPDYEYTDTILLDIYNLKAYVEVMLCRGKGGFERIMQTSQTHVALAEPGKLAAPDEKRKSFWSRFFRR
jgi:hypothetical protein